MWKPHEHKVYVAWVKAIIDEALGDLNDWETSFVLHMEEHICCEGRLPTEYQAKKLKDIYAEKTK
jgi:hypothetical protein